MCFFLLLWLSRMATSKRAGHLRRDARNRLIPGHDCPLVASTETIGIHLREKEMNALIFLACVSCNNTQDHWPDYTHNANKRDLPLLFDQAKHYHLCRYPKLNKIRETSIRTRAKLPWTIQLCLTSRFRFQHGKNVVFALLTVSSKLRPCINPAQHDEGVK